MRWLLPLVLLLWGCATTHGALPPTISAARRVELEPLPPDPSTEALPASTPPGDWVRAQEAGECWNAQGTVRPDAGLPCPAQAGILSSEARAARDALYRIRYRELRQRYEADRTVHGAQREVYETRLRLADERIRELQPTWWQQHGPVILFGAGLVLGTAIPTVIYVAVP